MDDQDEIDIERLRVDPELMQRVLEQQARKSKRKGWQRICTVVPREWELRLLEAKRISTYRLAIELLYLHWYGKGKPVTVSSKVAKAAKISARSKWERARRTGTAGPDRGGSQAAQVAAGRPAATPGHRNHEHDRAQSHVHDRAQDFRQHVHDRAQGVPILFSCSLTLVL